MLAWKEKKILTLQILYVNDNFLFIYGFIFNIEYKFYQY